jgi:hypothetical protein
MESTLSPRREIWKRYHPFTEPRNLELVVLEVADDLDHGDDQLRRIEVQLKDMRTHFDSRMAKLTGIATGLLISVCTGVLLIGIQIATGR